MSAGVEGCTRAGGVQLQTGFIVFFLTCVHVSYTSSIFASGYVWRHKDIQGEEEMCQGRDVR